MLQILRYCLAYLSRCAYLPQVRHQSVHERPQQGHRAAAGHKRRGERAEPVGCGSGHLHARVTPLLPSPVPISSLYIVIICVHVVVIHIHAEVIPASIYVIHCIDNNESVIIHNNKTKWYSGASTCTVK